jgi:hypothetical protein
VGTQVSGDIKSEKVSKKVILQIPRAFEVNEKKNRHYFKPENYFAYKFRIQVR